MNIGNTFVLKMLPTLSAQKEAPDPIFDNKIVLKKGTMSLISKNGSGGAGQNRFWSHGGLFCELFQLS